MNSIFQRTCAHRRARLSSDRATKYDNKELAQLRRERGRATVVVIFRLQTPLIVNHPSLRSAVNGSFCCTVDYRNASMMSVTSPSLTSPSCFTGLSLDYRASPIEPVGFDFLSLRRIRLHTYEIRFISRRDGNLSMNNLSSYKISALY